MAAPPTTSTKSKTKTSTAPPASALKVGGFDWSGRAASPAPSSSSASDDEAEASTSKKTKSKSKSKAGAIDLAATAPDDSRPSTISEFDRALLSSPNSSFIWIQYMSFHLQLHEIEKARSIGRRALEKINYREEEEKLNVWMALVNLEIGFGTDESSEKVFKEASGYNDARLVHMRYAEALHAAGKDEVSFQWRLTHGDILMIFRQQKRRIKRQSRSLGHTQNHGSNSLSFTSRRTTSLPPVTFSLEVSNLSTRLIVSRTSDHPVPHWARARMGRPFGLTNGKCRGRGGPVPRVLNTPILGLQ